MDISDENLCFLKFKQKLSECFTLFHLMTPSLRLKTWLHWQEMTEFMCNEIKILRDKQQLSALKINTDNSNLEPDIFVRTEKDDNGTEQTVGLESIKKLDHREFLEFDTLKLDELNRANNNTSSQAQEKNVLRELKKPENSVKSDLTLLNGAENHNGGAVRTIHVVRLPIPVSEQVGEKTESSNKKDSIDGLVCEICRKTYRTKANLKRHHRRAHNPEKSFVKCPECSKHLSSKVALTIHMRSHRGERPYSCTKCDAKFTQRASLNYHLKIHTGEKSHLCDLCGKTFRQKSNLIMHKKRHLQVKDFRCDVCNREFVTKGDMERHKLSHTGDRLHLCCFCAKTFTRATYLQEHMNLHTGEKPHRCKHCDECFADSSSLSRHHKRFHAESPTGNSDKTDVEADNLLPPSFIDMNDLHNVQNYCGDEQPSSDQIYLGQNMDLSVISYLPTQSDMNLI
ncbi:uncharacterized protein LOC141902470 [Tubulanus polymorphus]|uniref:uncharacterized protein LOC141902470 n=1 Tax=Tubulanus polymorphus TaxID=672921 RepID=UPI003DA27B77